MDAEKFALTVIMGCIIAAVVSVSLAVAKRFKIKLPWDATITGCPKCGAAEDFKPGMTRDMIGTDGPVVRREPRSGSMDDLVNVVAVISGIGVTLVGCVLLLSGVAAWVVGGSGISVAIIRPTPRHPGQHVGLAAGAFATGGGMQGVRLAGPEIRGLK